MKSENANDKDPNIVCFAVSLNFLIVFFSIPVSKAKILSLAAIVVLIAGGIWFFYRFYQESDKVDQFNRHAIVSNGPECADIGM